MAEERPTGASTLWGEWRRGLKDLQNVALDPWHGQTATHEEPGTIANPTSQRVSAEMEGGREAQHEAAVEAPERKPSETVYGQTIQGSKEATGPAEEKTVQEATPVKEAEGSVHGEKAPQQESHEAMLERYAQQGMERQGAEQGLERE